MQITVAQACDRWAVYRARMVELDLVARSTYSNQLQVAGAIVAGLGTVALDDLRKSDIDIWIGERRQTHAPITVRAELNVLRQILNWCVDEQLLGQRPRLPTVQVPNEEQPLPSDAAFVWALRAVPVHHCSALEFMMLTGLSPHEGERLQVRDYRHVANNDGGIAIGHRPDFKIKTPSRRRIVPLNERARLLWNMMASGKRPIEQVLPRSAAMQKALARARSLDDAAPDDAHRITPKLMRQWFASKVSGDSPEHVLQRLLGHAPGSKITRRHYVRSAERQLTDAVEGLRA